MILSFSLPIEPKSVQHGVRARVIKGKFCGLYNDADKQRYMDSIIQESKPYAPLEPSTGPLEVEYKFYLKKPEECASDTAHVASANWDNLVKGLQDALSKARFWKNDKQICRAQVWKLWAEDDLWPRIEVTIKQYNEQHS